MQTLIIMNDLFQCISLVLRGHIHEKGPAIAQYLADNYCPTLEDQADCPDHLAHWYPHLLQVPQAVRDHSSTFFGSREAVKHSQIIIVQALVRHYVVDGAEHLCMSLGACQPNRELV